MSTWNPQQYNRFRSERQQPFFDLLALVRRRAGMRIVDLGCGTGELTRVVHDQLESTETLGIDRSETMLADSQSFAAPGLRFALGDIAGFDAVAAWDLVFSNAALQWVDDHPQLLERLTAALSPGGQLAVQMPLNYDHPSHIVAAAVAAEAPFRDALRGFAIHRPVETPDWYATALYRLGYAEQHVRLQVYGHVLEARDEVIEWVKGTLLTAYQQRLPADLWPRFLDRYRELLLAQLDDTRPYFYPFKRLLLWGRRP